MSLNWSINRYSRHYRRSSKAGLIKIVQFELTAKFGAGTTLAWALKCSSLHSLPHLFGRFKWICYNSIEEGELGDFDGSASRFVAKCSAVACKLCSVPRASRRRTGGDRSSRSDTAFFCRRDHFHGRIAWNQHDGDFAREGTNQRSLA